MFKQLVLNNLKDLSRDKYLLFLFLWFTSFCDVLKEIYILKLKCLVQHLFGKYLSVYKILSKTKLISYIEAKKIIEKIDFIEKKLVKSLVNTLNKSC